MNTGLSWQIAILSKSDFSRSCESINYSNIQFNGLDYKRIRASRKGPIGTHKKSVGFFVNANGHPMPIYSMGIDLKIVKT